MQLFLLQLVLYPRLEEIHNDCLDFLLDILALEEVHPWEDSLQTLNCCLCHYDDFRDVHCLVISEGKEQDEEIHFVLDHVCLGLESLA